MASDQTRGKHAAEFKIEAVRQVKAVQALHTPYVFNYPLANGVRGYPAWGLGGENAQGTGPVGGWGSWQTGRAPPAFPSVPANSIAWIYGGGAVQYFFARDAHYDPRKFDQDALAGRVREISALMDSTNPDLSAFAARGGKLIVSEHMADYAQSPYAGIEYYQSVVARMGQASVDGFMRLYVTPGADHVGMGVPAGFDVLDVLGEWIEKGRAPGELVQVAQQMTPPVPVLAARPMCRYPAYPHSVGGDRARAESYACRPSNP